MNIISHRGYWHQQTEKNTESAFRRSFDLGIGTETDLRDCMGRLVISHDMPNGSEMDLQTFLQLVGPKPLPLALNIKADGLAGALSQAMKNYDRDCWFVFDMSIPDMRSHIEVGNPVFARMSEVEQHPIWLEKVTGVWLDSFKETWFENSLILDTISRGKKVCVVSPELHGRDPAQQWEQLRPLSSCEDLILCTDLPVAANQFFFGDSR